jgi:DNA-binding transcriptional LysR family regulator
VRRADPISPRDGPLQHKPTSSVSGGEDPGRFLVSTVQRDERGVCREAGFVPHAPHEVDHLHMVLRMVAAGAGVALVPGSTRKTNQGRVACRALRPSPGNLKTAMAWRREDTSATVAEFISAARRSLRHLRE